MRRRISIVTIGCKANFADSAALAAEAAAWGFDVAVPGEPADLVVVNGCAVTHRAARDSRSAARRARRDNPGASVVMTGCFARLAPPPEGGGELIWLPHAAGEALAEVFLRAGGVAPRGEERPTDHDACLALGHRRTFLRVQDGCDAACAYCVIPRARGRGRSLPADEVVRRAVLCEGAGARELVLTGIRLGAYGADRGERGGLARLLRSLVDATRTLRIRLGSVEPGELDEDLVETIGGHERLCPHLHVPLQSGSDAVLARMRRPYRAAAYGQAVERAFARIRDLQVGADVIVGFPGETEEDFRRTVGLLAGLPVHYLHVFPYSPRAGTESAAWADDVPAAVKRERVRTLLELDRSKRAAFRRAFLGRILEVLAERFDAATGELTGYSANYLPVAFAGAPGGVGTVWAVEAAEVRAGGILGGTLGR